MGPAGSKAELVPRGNPAWTRQLCAELTTSPSPALALLVLPSCVRAQKQHCTAIPVLALSHHGVRSCWQSVQGLPTARWDGDKDLVLPGQAVGLTCSTTLWSWEGGSQSLSPAGGCPPPSPRHQVFLLLVTSAFSCFLWRQDGITPAVCAPSPQLGSACSACTTLPQHKPPDMAPGQPRAARVTACQQVTGTVGTAPGSVPPQAHSYCPCRAPRALAQRSAKHVRRELHRSDGQHSPLAPFEAMGRSSSNCSESQTWLLSMGPTGMVLA